MAFESMPGIEGKIFIPDEDPGERKHPCTDCYACQLCSDDRCRVCRSEHPSSTSHPLPKGCCRASS
jgi:hypothetical protein